MTNLKRSVAGIRGIWGESLFPETAVHYASAFAMFIGGGKVVIGRDTRTTGTPLKYAALSALLSYGCEVIDIDIAPTPTCQLAVEKFKANGGIIITASHNPFEWNGIKFVNSRGEFLNEHNFKAITDLIDNHQIKYQPINKNIVYDSASDYHTLAIDEHIKEISGVIDVDLIRSRSFKVAFDAVNGAGSRLMFPLFKHLNVEVVPIYCDESGQFPRGAEPMPENLTALSALVKKSGADIGFAVDPDADRLSIVSEFGEPLGEEMSLPLVAQHIVSQTPGVIVTNLSTSMAIDFVAEKYHCKLIRTKIGEANVVQGMKDNHCIVGGEGNGGIILPQIHYSRDTGIGIGLILDYLAKSGKTISELANTIPKLYMVKSKLDLDEISIQKAIDYVKVHYESADVNTLDGVKVTWKDSWMHLRQSGTEGMLRIFAEASSVEKAQGMVDEITAKIKKLI
ncbi:phosphoglucosamine mutase [candidate division KSB1 bacterium]|nr:phosphoglucosamine mutase [candidate division KSB1 bacterium]